MVYRIHWVYSTYSLGTWHFISYCLPAQLLTTKQQPLISSRHSHLTLSVTSLLPTPTRNLPHTFSQPPPLTSSTSPSPLPLSISPTHPLNLPPHPLNPLTHSTSPLTHSTPSPSPTHPLNLPPHPLNPPSPTQPPPSPTQPPPPHPLNLPHPPALPFLCSALALLIQNSCNCLIFTWASYPISFTLPESTMNLECACT